MENFSKAAQNNTAPILVQLERLLTTPATVLEVGSGSGQHAINFAQHLSHLTWQPTDQGEYFPGLQTNLRTLAPANVLAPLVLDLAKPWPVNQFDHVYCANVLHIAPLSRMAPLFQNAGLHLPPGGYLLIYGPFKYDGQFTTPSNKDFDAWLKARHAESGIRDFEFAVECATRHDLELKEDVRMPANNQFLVFQKT